METKSRISGTGKQEIAELVPEGAAGDIENSIEIEKVRKSSTKFIGKWNNLVSTTNWDKGKIIIQWREALTGKDAKPAEYSDEAWARLVGGVTSQHVGRLRRVYQRFGDTHKEYANLYWTHFHAANEWNDAEMWLEGAVQSKWSVSQMRNQRWEAMGGEEADRPNDSDIIASELDEDFEPANSAKPQEGSLKGQYDEIAGPRYDDPDFGDEGTDPSKLSDDIHSKDGKEKIDFVRPFENIADLPEDLADAFEAFKLAILAHKVAGWVEVSCEDVMASLDALKQLATAPSDDR